MAIALGVDTGGTYTDAVLVRDDREVLGSAKALTTRRDLAIGIGNAVRAVLQEAGVAAGQVAMASLSTTLATNALVEGQGGRIGLIYIGFREADLDRHGVRAALGGDPALVVAGGHDHAGNPAEALDVEAIDRFLAETGASVSAVAVAGKFATRNPAHELAAAERVRQVAGVPVTCAHLLSARLNGPKRALTAVLNARLIGMIERLIARAEATLGDLGIAAPLRVVRGDGALMSAEQARARPIETILSGPAASLVGAQWLCAAPDAVVSDIGGTTTDVAFLRGGKPAIDPLGAQVGGFRTMVEAVAMRTTGLGGDSEVHPVLEGLDGGVRLGPRRVLPVSLLAQEDPEVVHRALRAQLDAATPGEHDGRFVRRVPEMEVPGLSKRDAEVLSRIGPVALPLADVVRTRMDLTALGRLRDRGAIQVAGVTPSDAAHVLQVLASWDAEAARMALTLMARRRMGTGDRLAADADALADQIVRQVTHQTAVALLEAAFDEERDGFARTAEDLARLDIVQAGLRGHRGALRIDVGLNQPVIGLGASAPTYYPAVGARLNTQIILPDHAGVANAIGAVVGRIALRRSGSVTAPSEGQFRVHLAEGPRDFSCQDKAMQCLEAALIRSATQAVQDAGAEDVEVDVSRDVRMARTEAREVFVEAEITVEASGRPRIAVS